jgi:hypothetical protein
VIERSSTGANPSALRTLRAANWKSASALSTHSAVVFFIQDFSLGHNLSQERITLRQAPGHVLGRANNQIERERRVKGLVDATGLIDLIPRWHDDKDVYVTVGVWRPVGIRAEENDLLGLKALGYLAGKAANLAPGNIGPTIPADRFSCVQRATFGCHNTILPQRRVGTNEHGSHSGTAELHLKRRRLAAKRGDRADLHELVDAVFQEPEAGTSDLRSVQRIEGAALV